MSAQSFPTGIAQVTPGSGQFVKAVASAGTSERFSASDLFVRSFEVHARKNTTTANTGAVYVGPSSTPLRVLLAGDPPWSVAAPRETFLNLKDWYVDAATTADAVTVTYVI